MTKAMGTREAVHQLQRARDILKKGDWQLPARFDGCEESPMELKASSAVAKAYGASTVAWASYGPDADEAAFVSDVNACLAAVRAMSEDAEYSGVKREWSEVCSAAESARALALKRGADGRRAGLPGLPALAGLAGPAPAKRARLAPNLSDAGLELAPCPADARGAVAIRTGAGACVLFPLEMGGHVSAYAGQEAGADAALIEDIAQIANCAREPASQVLAWLRNGALQFRAGHVPELD